MNSYEKESVGLDLHDDCHGCGKAGGWVNAGDIEGCGFHT